MLSVGNCCICTCSYSTKKVCRLGLLLQNCGKIVQFLQFFTPIFFSSGGRQLNVLAFYDRDAFLTLSAILHYTTVV